MKILLLTCLPFFFLGCVSSTDAEGMKSPTVSECGCKLKEGKACSCGHDSAEACTCAKKSMTEGSQKADG